jgi:hypothetical protein
LWYCALSGRQNPGRQNPRVKPNFPDQAKILWAGLIPSLSLVPQMGLNYIQSELSNKRRQSAVSNLDQAPLAFYIGKWRQLKPF